MTAFEFEPEVTSVESLGMTPHVREPTGSDHRLLQAHVHIRVLNTGKTRISSHTTKKSRSIDGSLLEESLSCATLQNKNDIDAAYLFFVDTLKGAVERAKTCGPGINKSRISEETKQSMQRRRELKRDGSHNVEYSIICKLIRSKVKEDVEIFRQERLLKAAEERRSTKNVGQRKGPGKDGIIVEMLKVGGLPLWREIARMFSRYLELRRISKAWKQSKTILLYKKGCSTEITFFNAPINIPVSKGVEQGDSISPKLFSACIEMMIRKLNWKKGINIDGEHLIHLRFADDLVLLRENADTVQKMLRKLEKEGGKNGLRINRSKTKIMRSPVQSCP
ncbi:hypothetical protein ANCCEY_04638 [Ancylostoma ceylanicum]|uniref:Reverse transcriptase domain-containing protein n=1 Tax=Ancylostoma ceylanicum TaxID=53326 RepID=A0A0D6M1R8_9BILA|nr:hypothetical protein ANCCEY_04638 [Ancylostoma ceylanicum]